VKEPSKKETGKSQALGKAESRGRQKTVTGTGFRPQTNSGRGTGMAIAWNEAAERVIRQKNIATTVRKNVRNVKSRFGQLGGRLEYYPKRTGRLGEKVLKEEGIMEETTIND